MHIFLHIIHKYIYTQAYIHTYIHTYIHIGSPLIKVYIHSFIHTYSVFFYELRGAGKVSRYLITLLTFGLFFYGAEILNLTPKLIGVHYCPLFF